MKKPLIVGTCRIDLVITDSKSLKDKRQVIKSLIDQIRGKFNVSIAQVDKNNSWQRATLGISCVNTDRRHANKVIDKIVQFIKSHPKVVLVDYEVEII